MPVLRMPSENEEALLTGDRQPENTDTMRASQLSKGRLSPSLQLVEGNPSFFNPFLLWSHRRTRLQTNYPSNHVTPWASRSHRQSPFSVKDAFMRRSSSGRQKPSLDLSSQLAKIEVDLAKRQVEVQLRRVELAKRQEKVQQLEWYFERYSLKLRDKNPKQSFDI